MLRGQVLVEGAAQSHIQELEAPADAQDGLVLLQSPVQEFPLQGIPGGAQLATGGLQGLSVQLRSDILPASEEKAVTEIRELGDVRSVRRQRQDDRNGTGLFQRFFPQYLF